MEADGPRYSRNGNGAHGIHGSSDGATALLESRRRILLIADEVLRAEEFLAEVRHRGFLGSPRRLSVLVITPSLPGSALGQAASDIDEAVVDAYSRLDEILGELHRVGVPAAGMVGDDDPVVALGDGLRLFDADDVVVIGHIERDAGWAERDLWERIETNFDEEIAALLVERPEASGGLPGVVETRTSLDVEEEEASLPSRVASEAVAAIFTGLSGTILLGFLVVGAADSMDLIQGDLPGPIAAMILITIAAFLFNLAAIVALTFSLALDYRGFGQRLIARSTIALTIFCLIASALVWAIFL